MGRCGGGGKVAWGSWEKIYLPKECDCLVIKESGKFNYALLSKWRWRLLNDEVVLGAGFLLLTMVLIPCGFHFFALPMHLYGGRISGKSVLMRALVAGLIRGCVGR